MSAAGLSVAVIEEDDILYRWVFKGHVKADGTIKPNAYMRSGQPDTAASCDLKRLGTAYSLWARSAQKEKTTIGELSARIPISLGLRVVHEPLSDNPAHTSIYGLAEATDGMRLCSQLARNTRRLPDAEYQTP